MLFGTATACCNEFFVAVIALSRSDSTVMRTGLATDGWTSKAATCRALKRKDTLCRKGTASGKATLFERVPARGNGARESLRKHRGRGQELRVSRRQLYRWRDELDPEEPVVGKPAGQDLRACTLRKEVNHLKRVLAEMLEVDFFNCRLLRRLVGIVTCWSLSRPPQALMYLCPTQQLWELLTVQFEQPDERTSESG
jgi:hypothetical protein